MQVQQSFAEYYGTEVPIDKTSNQTIAGRDGNYYIHNAVFSFHSKNSAIKLWSNDKVLLESCTFYNNSSTEDGGSICIQDSESVLVRICLLFSSIISSNSNSIGCGYYIYSDQYSKKKSYAFECSVSQCSGKSASLYHYGGYIQVSHMNTSYHEIGSDARYYIIDPTERGNINFTTASNSSSISEVFSTSNFNFTKCNYLNNECKGSDDTIILNYNADIYSNCSFIGNKGPYLFLNKPQAVDNCYFDNEGVTVQTVQNDNSASFESISPFDSLLSHYTTGDCSATYFYKTISGEFLSLKKRKIRYVSRRR
ncbi:hypothetical protein TVAG_403330 [Trichomonas vaginalis G3]|uniref:Right handed beta helix domain-containing protein n=1 Tax=Trichomonas vaginalis (strain ATCC PRA-98 / G3) TaxID=412133 RepID=A2F8W9_TRIV3|nr:hypothetical protein TVAGG3_0689110 [Trichomonas vaginalis G3]EAX98651.1 hypothetical protein TVAG_403330 [Trichomonas vaginalis G3]KAI5508435.1 hypothetical protein TVAGG3_0689110 [Trichomonas vaginalis G3]|eukprot:XP_001311581.1 hypothetical protein [Trichomonas vaginalis G3]